jgi:hypothetical protein
MNYFKAAGLLALGLTLLAVGLALLFNLAGSANRLAKNAGELPPRRFRLYVMLWPEEPIVWRLGGLLMIGMGVLSLMVAWHVFALVTTTGP